ncbi:NYN domain-containing protein [Candidatus Saccharibacteria bacterium]|nr:NYN domain-containing protein [Candidatus Saccharibacteria bacterium]
MNKLPANIYIDGENLLYGLLPVLLQEKLVTERADLVKFDLISLFIEATKDNAKPIKIFYYGTKPHIVKDMGEEALEASTKMHEHKQAWGEWLDKQQILYITAGNLKARQKKEGVVFQEKGVDVRLAVDMVKQAYEGPKMNFVVASSDSDIIPALRVVKEKGHNITYVAMPGGQNRAISAHADKTIILKRQAIVDGYKEVNS